VLHANSPTVAVDELLVGTRDDASMAILIRHPPTRHPSPVRHSIGHYDGFACGAKY
jgi:hypothetical protein